jgi:hypothetical protein
MGVTFAEAEIEKKIIAFCKEDSKVIFAKTTG